jgi:hypothetical protein
MTECNNELEDLEKLLAEVRQTIRDNEQFVRHLKSESVESDAAEEENEDEQNNNTGSDTDEYEEL